MVFRATWNPSGHQDFPGRAYVTTKEMYFYSNHFGLVLTSGISLSHVDEVTAAPGKDCDFLFVHFKEQSSSGTTRITIKTFLEPLKLLRRRLNYLVNNCQDDSPRSLDEIIRDLIKMESEIPKRTPSMDSWEENSGDAVVTGRPRAYSEYRAPTRIDRGLYGSINESSTAFKLPAHPVKYSPPGYTRLAVEREYDISPKALFHVMFGDRSALWQLLQHERRAKDLKQGPWTPLSEDLPGRLGRDFTFSIPVGGSSGAERYSPVKDYQTIDVMNDHLCYVVTDRRTPWHLPFQASYKMISKIVITHVAKTKCKLAIYTRVDWLSHPWIPMLEKVINEHALGDLDLDALDLADLVGDQVRRLGFHSRTKKSVQIFGQVGHSSEITQSQINASAHSIEMRHQPKKRTIWDLLLQDIASAAQSQLGTFLQTAIDLSTWLNKTISANSIILAILAASMLYNSFFALRDSWSWYKERNTAKFMRRLGVTPDHVMGRAIYINDLNTAMTMSSSASYLPTSTVDNACYRVFSDEYLETEVYTPIASSSSSNIDTNAAQRLQLARQKIALQRHDLLVSMRVVNGIEQDIVSGAYERWTRSENARCRALDPVLANGTANKGGKALIAGMGVGKEEEKRLADWYKEYCTSCVAEYARIEGKEV